MSTKFLDMLKAAEDAIDSHDKTRNDAKPTQVNLTPITPNAQNSSNRATLNNIKPISFSANASDIAAKTTEVGLSPVASDGAQVINDLDIEVVDEIDDLEINPEDLEQDLDGEDLLNIDVVSEDLELDLDFNFEMSNDPRLAETQVPASTSKPPQSEADKELIDSLQLQISRLQQEKTKKDEEIQILIERREEVSRQLTASEARAAQLQDKLVRTTADYDNYRKRVARDKEQDKFLLQKKIITDFLGVMDNLERGLQHAKSSSDFDNLLHGVELTARQYLTTLAKYGCTPFDSLGKEFDPSYHEVLTQVNDDSVPNNSIVQEHLKGYMLQNMLLRPALVVVAQNNNPAPGSVDSVQENDDIDISIDLDAIVIEDNSDSNEG